jgi:hypothetical protein
MTEVQKVLSPIIYMGADAVPYLKLREFLEECHKDYHTNPRAKTILDSFVEVSHVCDVIIKETT